MAIIYSYPQKSAALTDNVLISDSTSNSPKQQTKQTSISSIKDVINVVDSLNSLTGDLNITGGTNITVTPSGQNIEISTSASNVDGSGTAGTIPKWSDSNTLTDSIIKDQGGLDILIPRYIKHDGDTSNLFGFKDTGEFLVSVDSTARDQFSVAANAIIMKTDSGTKLAAGPTSVTLYNDENGSTTTSKISLTTYDSGVIVKGGTENSFARGGAVRFYTSTNNGYVGISGPTTSGTNYEIILPNAVGAANQVLKLPSPIGSSPFQLAWSDAGSDAQGSTGSVQFKASTGVFQGSDSFIFESSNDKLIVGDTANDRAGIIEIQSDENGGTLKIGGGSQSYYTSIKGSDTDTASYNIILPPAGPGSNNKILESNSTGQLSWITTPGGAPGGSTGSVQFRNSSGAFAGDSNLLFNSGILTVGEAGGDKGTVIIEAEDGVGSGILKIGHQNVSNYLSLGLGGGTMSSNYSIEFPVASPGGNNKILESNSSGQLTWITTPTGSSLTAGSGIQIGSGTIQTDNLANGGIIYSGASNELAVDVGASAIIGTLPVARGGTGLSVSTTTLHDTLIGNGDSFVQSGTVNSAMQLPAGTTANRPEASEGNAGLIRYNTQTTNFEVCKETSAESGEYDWYTIDVTVIPS